MNKVEVTSFIRSIVLFFTSLAILIIILHSYIYKDKVQSHQNTLYSQMQIASLNLKSNVFTINFVQKSKDKKLYKLLKNDKFLYANFEITGSKKYFTEVTYPLESLKNDLSLIKNEVVKQAIIVLFIALFISILFSFYALYPLKQSLQMTNEFIKDILHDFNTPISTIRLNIDLLKDKNSKSVERIKGGVDTILNLQHNLKNYIDDEIGESETFDIKEMLDKRIDLLAGAYPLIGFTIEGESYKVKAYKDGLIRIVDNLLSNACKYNTPKGKVFLFLTDHGLSIKDTGQGIKNPKKVFNRFYKETSRGLGIGLHIVDKLAKKMNITIKVESQVDKGTLFTLNLSCIKTT